MNQDFHTPDEVEETPPLPAKTSDEEDGIETRRIVKHPPMPDVKTTELPAIPPDQVERQ